MGRSRKIREGRKRFLKKARPYILAGGGLLTLWWVFSLPDPLFDVSYSTVTESSEGRLLGARIAEDGQWRFPPPDSVPFRFEKCIIAFEDERFESHFGVDPIAVGRAIAQNFKADEVVSGASTLTMQVIRLARNNPERSYFEKLTEMLRATRLEAGYSKEEILKMYAAHAPFGGNVVGIEAAAWRYYGRPPHLLTWAECAALAVLPNAPSRIRPDRNRDEFLRKRNRVLEILVHKSEIDSVTFRLALREPLPDIPLALPDDAHHLTERQQKENPGSRFKTDIRADWQIRTQNEVDLHARRWIRNQVHNAGALVMDIQTGKTVVYVGNTNNSISDAHEVDMLDHPRSTGSILKPFLYSQAMQEGRLSPASLIADIPTRFGDFTPTNFDRSFRGAVEVEKALQLSLNVPAARVLRDMGVPIFHHKLRGYGMLDLGESSARYGLSLILGGAEVRPVQVAHAYRRWILGMLMIPDTTSQNVWGERMEFGPIPETDPASVYSALHIMEGLERPDEWERWGRNSGRRMAWKTGTSYGFRDAWAVGTDGRWLVVAWTGNASNEGRPGVIGVETSAPLLFRIMSLLPSGAFFEEPYDEQKHVVICAQSGYLAQVNCAVRDTVYLGLNGVAPCSYCKRIQLNTGGLRVDRNCASEEPVDTSWMILPAGMTWFAIQSGSSYRPVPEWDPECEIRAETTLQWIYPETAGEVVKRTRDLDGKLGAVVLEASHRSPDAYLFWYIDEEYVTSTLYEHRIEAVLSPGLHYLTISDEQGNRQTTSITVVE